MVKENRESSPEPGRLHDSSTSQDHLLPGTIDVQKHQIEARRAASAQVPDHEEIVDEHLNPDASQGTPKPERATDAGGPIDRDRGSADRGNENAKLLPGLKALDLRKARPECPDLEEPASEQRPGLVRRETEAFEKDTFQTFAECFAEVIAAAHGLGMVWEIGKWVWGTKKWLQVAEGRGGVDVPVPLPLPLDTVLEANVHLGGDRDTPPLTLSVAPSGASGVGALAFDGLEVDPAPSHGRGDADSSKAAPQRRGPVKIIAWQLRTKLPENLSPAEVVLAAREQEEQLGELWPHVYDDGVELVVGYDSVMQVAVWRERRR